MEAVEEWNRCLVELLGECECAEFNNVDGWVS